ncbi:partial tRNA dimethylallyltransferase, partial [Patescibacteria group bacterium]
ENYRLELYELRKKYGNEILFELLKEIDPLSASKMIPQNWKRVIRALEVYHSTGKPIHHFHAAQKKKENYMFVQYGLYWERPQLYENINHRVDEMIENGLVNEVKSILDMGCDKKLNALNTVGYKEIISYLEGEISLEQAIHLIKRNTRHFAKRQLTWFKRDGRVSWLQTNSFSDLIIHGETIIGSLNKDL